MSGRRTYERYALSNIEGTLRVLRSVTVQRGADDEYVAISLEPARLGELLTLERIVDGSIVTVRVRVIESRPVMVRGSVRHRLRLKPIDGWPDVEGTP